MKNLDRLETIGLNVMKFIYKEVDIHRLEITRPNTMKFFSDHIYSINTMVYMMVYRMTRPLKEWAICYKNSFFINLNNLF